MKMKTHWSIEEETDCHDFFFSRFICCFVSAVRLLLFSNLSIYLYTDRRHNYYRQWITLLLASQYVWPPPPPSSSTSSHDPPPTRSRFLWWWCCCCLIIKAKSNHKKKQKKNHSLVMVVVGDLNKWWCFFFLFRPKREIISILIKFLQISGNDLKFLLLMMMRMIN